MQNITEVFVQPKSEPNQSVLDFFFFWIFAVKT